MLTFSETVSRSICDQANWARIWSIRVRVLTPSEASFARSEAAQQVYVSPAFRRLFDAAAQEAERAAAIPSLTGQRRRRPWMTRSALLNISGTLAIAGVAWGAMTVWNVLHLAGLPISGDVQQVILEGIVAIGILRLFDFHPRRDPDFAWVLLTRLVMMLGISTIQTFLFFYMRDAVGAAHPEQQTPNFVIIVSLTSLMRLGKSRPLRRRIR